MTASVVVAVLGWVAGWVLWGRPRRLRPAPPDASGARLTVIIPARDEAEVIGGLLDDLLGQSVRLDRVVVVDDHSTDGTARVAAERGPLVQVLEAPALPAGWTGKSWACHTGVQAAAREGLAAGDAQLLVFVDADVRLGDGALAAVAAQHATAGDAAVSIQPHHVTRRPDEQLSLLCGLVALCALGAGRRGGSPAGLSGPLIATTYGDYRRAGGHAAVRGEVIEDVALGQRYLASGLRTSVLLGDHLVRYRMYPRGLRQLIEGWSKNLASGAGAVPLWRTVLTTLWITAMGSAVVDLVTAVIAEGAVAPWLAALVYLAFVVQVGLLGAALGTFPALTALVYPVPLIAFVGLFLRSVWRTHVRRRVVWRGRSLPVGARARR